MIVRASPLHLHDAKMVRVEEAGARYTSLLGDQLESVEANGAAEEATCAYNRRPRYIDHLSFGPICPSRLLMPSGTHCMGVGA